MSNLKIVPKTRERRSHRSGKDKHIQKDTDNDEDKDRVKNERHGQK